MRKGILPLSLAILCSCHHSDSSFAVHRHKGFSEIATTSQQPREPQIEWLYYEGLWSGYINIVAGELSSESGQIEVEITTEERTLSFHAPILKGGQKVAIPSSMVMEIIAFFEEAPMAKLQISGYQVELNLHRFSDMVNKAKKKHPLSLFRSMTLFDL